MTLRAVIDACVLYPTVLREIVLGVARAGLIEPLWSDRLLEEWARTAARHGGAVDEALARGDIAALALAFPKARLPADPGLEARLWLPDSGDVHVLATAITGQAEAIITLNLRDFPARELMGQGVRALHPDATLHDLWLAHPDRVAPVVGSVHAKAEQLSGASLDKRALLKRARLPRLAKALG
ncbi:PIN domain-containing protein [Roseicyclus marinus]|uniref:PIN domain-containing protein n=1 Tax=Roseicyclus marinus TaxID=2161673 RepID=A0AA48KL75_9RHOB|nr:PIN domain-containing protein [Roseicyclus marinus]